MKMPEPCVAQTLHFGNCKFITSTNSFILNETISFLVSTKKSANFSCKSYQFVLTLTPQNSN